MESYEEKLIELVRKHPELYDTSNSKYVKTKFKQEIWAKIAKQLNLKSGEKVKYSWLKLRNNHRDALRRQRRMRRSGVAAADIKLWRFQTQMEFLIRFMGNENRDTNCDEDDDRSEPPSEEEQYVKAENQNLDDNTFHVANAVYLPAPDSAYVDEGDSLNSSENNEPAESSASQPKKIKVKKCDADNSIKKNSEREQRSKERSEERRKFEEKPASRDDLYLFFMSMYEQTKNMPPASQHIVRRNVFLTVSQEGARLLNIAEPSVPQYQQLVDTLDPSVKKL